MIEPTQPRILVVDDNTLVRKVVTKVLSGRDYVIETAASAKIAQQKLTQSPCDLLILDILMPVMNGLELARWVREQPTIRELPILFFSTVTDPFHVRQAASIGNVDYVIKPLRRGLFLDRVERSLVRRRMAYASSSDAKLQEIQRAGRIQIPTFGESTLALLELIHDADAAVKSYVAIVQKDPGLSAMVLRVVNSALYALPNQVASVHDACALIGVRDLSSICLSASIAQSMNPGSMGQVRNCWKVCVETSRIARAIATRLCPDDEAKVSIAGLLHGLGVVALFNSPEVEYSKVVDLANVQRRDLVDVERELLGFDHAQLNQQLAIRMGLSSEIQGIVSGWQFHDRNRSAASFCVAVASLLVQGQPGAFRISAEPQHTLELLAMQFPERWKTAEREVGEMLSTCQEHADLVCG